MGNKNSIDLYNILNNGNLTYISTANISFSNSSEPVPR